LYKIVAYLIIGVQYFLELVSWVILINALLSWVLPPTSNFRNMLESLVSPFVNPFRRISERLFSSSGLPIDLSPFFAYVTITIVLYLLDMVVDVSLMVSHFY